ncbi:hypothetical protein ZIOFF_059483 [Zingiber officinale]|uniref:Uncharacterized protein n=1 Tax=Zingiber officinale TaxID=94328 RepID=A0A8J5FKF0_ZINOF|nr:hypothetical protein ZIOFF_059483 [Zingiber officinale]
MSRERGKEIIPYTCIRPNIALNMMRPGLLIPPILPVTPVPKIITGVPLSPLPSQISYPTPIAVRARRTPCKRSSSLATQDVAIRPAVDSTSSVSLPSIPISAPRPPLISSIVCGKSNMNPQSRDLVLQLVERILSGPKARTILLNGAVRKGERIVPHAVLDLLMRATFPASTARVKATERFETFYPTLKELALTGSSTKTTKQASQQLLPFAIQAIQEKNVGATIIVLRELSTEWRNYSAKISPDTLKVTLKHLRAKNEDALSRNTDPSQVASIKEVDKYYKTILMKLTRNFDCMKGSVLVLVLGIASCSYCYLLSIPPMLRKYGFHLVLSGNRYYISDQGDFLEIDEQWQSRP